MEDLFESIIGAIYIDSAFDMTSVIKSLSIMLDLSEYLRAAAAPTRSYKNLLQEWCADKKRRMPSLCMKRQMKAVPITISAIPVYALSVTKDSARGRGEV